MDGPRRGMSRQVSDTVTSPVGNPRMVRGHTDDSMTEGNLIKNLLRGD